MISRTLKLSLVAVVVAVFLSPSLATSKPVKGSELPPPDGAAVIHPGDADYRIGAQDVLDINVFQVPDLSKSVQVDTGGKILLPLVGPLQAAGRTPFELSQDLSAAL